MKKQILVLSFVLLALTACVPMSTDMPPYMVMLTSGWPGLDSRCTGELLDPLTILTANHCTENNVIVRAVTQYGQESFITPCAHFPDLDIALFCASLPLYAPSYAHLAAPDLTKPAQAFGVCPSYFSHVPRQTTYVPDPWSGIIKPNYTCQMWHAMLQSICGGDSGGMQDQDGAVTGIIVAVETSIPFLIDGTEVCVIPSDLIIPKIEQFTRGTDKAASSGLTP